MSPRFLPQAVKCFQRHDSETRAMHAASFRLTRGQRESVGVSFWVHPFVEVLAFSTRRAAENAARLASWSRMEAA